ncbi:MAG: hypothetical protein UZ06_CHB003000043 [Chlorobi bacterium OLB6]|jgi:hypothetical protein|nr:MAG: hypothetical protein UZ06_CHB003000043 [Chlorobi bacterium OLB6]
MVGGHVERIKLVGILLTVLLFLPVLAWSQDTTSYPSPCKPCKAAVRAWSQVPVQSVYVTIGNCTFRAFFKKRTCITDACQELKLEKIEMTDPNPCDEIPVDEVPGMVLGKMIETNAMGFYPDTIQQGANGCWKFTRPLCWRVQNQASASCPPTTPGAGDLIDSARVRYEIGELAPCDTNACCTNVLYPTRNICGEIIFDVPEPGDYPWLHHLRNQPADSSDSARFENGAHAFSSQFEDSTCTTCTSGGVPPPSPCKRSCEVDIMAEYRRLINARLERLYGE